MINKTPMTGMTTRPMNQNQQNTPRTGMQTQARRSSPSPTTTKAPMAAAAPEAAQIPTPKSPTAPFEPMEPLTAFEPPVPPSPPTPLSLTLMPPSPAHMEQYRAPEGISEYDTPARAKSAKEPLPESLRNTLFTPGYLRTQIGKMVHVEFLLGMETMVDRKGVLVEVGANYIILQSMESNNQLLCDIHSIKFVTVMDHAKPQPFGWR